MGSLLGAGGLLDGGLIRGWGLNKLSRWTKVLSGWSCSTEMLHTASPGKGGGVSWINVCWVCTAGLSEPLPHYSLLCGHL